MDLALSLFPTSVVPRQPYLVQGEIHPTLKHINICKLHWRIGARPRANLIGSTKGVAWLFQHDEF